MNRVNRERTLDRRERTQSGIAAFKLLHHESKRGVAHSGAAMFFQVRRKKSELAHSRNKLIWKFSSAMTRHDLRHGFLLNKTPRPIARRALIVDEKFFDAVIIERSHTQSLASNG